ncbi:uncharacterized protein TRIADDRAFT_63721 [Trichoplax adhaerens]|uniref:Uncharacterized protein n=1 Tax=Trichoplax adhaerens TaxID=10228 RepID=B3RR93_TRIAD|nr:predicted protein [Trichoplax adhaerens]EDV26837.1 predicted protein [Trichoplax adhaerens]|eukprot:XP_002110833.1 predicted protein [Trichoplax adhaerens]
MASFSDLEEDDSITEDSNDSEDEDLAKIDALLDHFSLAVETFTAQNSISSLLGCRKLQVMISCENYQCLKNEVLILDCNFTADCIPVLINLLASPYEDLAIKSMQLLIHCAEEILITRVDDVQKIADVIAKGRSTQFLRSTASLVYACMKYLYQSPHIIPLLQIVVLLIKSDDVKVLKEILKAWTVIIINRHTIFSYIRDETDDELWQLNMDLIPTGYACEIVASQSLYLQNPIVELLYFAIEKFLLDSKVLSYLHNLLRKKCIHSTSDLSEILTIINRLIYHGYELVQKMIDEDVVSTIFKCSEMSPGLDRKMITSIFADMINFASDDQVRDLVQKHDRMIIYLFASLIDQNKYKNMMPSFFGLHSVVSKCKWLPNLSKEMKNDALAQLRIIHTNGQPEVSALAEELYSFIQKFK